MTTVDELAAQVAELSQLVTSLQRTLNPVDASGLPVPTRYQDDRDPHIRHSADGPRWQVGKWTVIALDDDHDGCVYLRDPYGQNTGDTHAMLLAEAVQVAGALLAAARYTSGRAEGMGEDLGRRRRKPAV